MPKPTFASARLPLAAAAFLAAAPMAHAQARAPDIWADWQGVSGRFGGTLDAGSSDYAGGTLTLRDVTFRTEGTGARTSADLGTITMTEQEDGSVDIALPARFETRGTAPADGGEIEQTTTIENEALTIVAQEDEGRRTYDIDADAMTVVMETVAAVAEETAEPTRVTLRLDGIESEILTGLGAAGDGFEQSYSVDGMEVVSGYAGEEGALSFTYALTGVTSDVEGRYGEGTGGEVRSLADLDIAYAGTVEHSGSTLEVAAETPDGPLDISGSAEAGTIAFDLAETSLSYSLTSTGGAVTAQLPGFPLPVDLSMREVRSAFSLPRGETGTEQPFGFEIALRDLEVDDVLWSLFDPAGELPREPATVEFDLDGTAVMDVDLFGDPAAAEALDGPPGALRSLTLNTLLVALAGAELRGSGAVTFAEGVEPPEPVGTVDLALDGGFALLDRLVALQLITPQQAAFVKGMAGAVAETVGEDALETTVEFLPGGAVTANGMPVK